MTDKLPPKILVAEQDEVTNATLCNMIERYWFDVIRAKTFETATRVAVLHNPHLCVISSRIKDKPATEAIKALRQLPNLSELPVIFLLEPDESPEAYREVGGANCEVLARPFGPNELMTCIRNLIRKVNPVLQDKIISYDDIRMDLSTFKVHRGNKQVHLGPTEFKILQLFVQRPKNIYSRQQIIDYVWGTEEEISIRTIDVHINRLRSLMKLETDRYPIIKTIRAAGYCLD
jgi:two-component system phosphate regulon response regulator PhoB